MDILANKNYKKQIEQYKKIAIVTSTTQAPIFKLSNTPDFTIYSILKKEYKVNPGFPIVAIVNANEPELFNFIGNEYEDIVNDKNKNAILYFEDGELLVKHII